MVDKAVLWDCKYKMATLRVKNCGNLVIFFSHLKNLHVYYLHVRINLMGNRPQNKLLLPI